MTDKLKTEEVEFHRDDEFVIYTTSANRRNRLRDIGLFIVVVLWFVSAFIWWRDAANREALNVEIAETYKIELNKFRAEVATLQKDQDKSMVVKEDILRELRNNRDTMLKAHKAHDERMTRAIQILERLEKKVGK